MPRLLCSLRVRLAELMFWLLVCFALGGREEHGCRVER